MTQRRIVQLTPQSQSEVTEIVQGRRVRDVEVLERIAAGLGAVTPELARLARKIAVTRI